MGHQELRQDPVAGRAVIIAPDRRSRPNDYENHGTDSQVAGCPFCPGNEHLTPSEIMADRPEDSGKDKPGWALRVVPNKYPVLSLYCQVEREDGGIHEKENAVGTHEVIIESPDHGMSLSALSVPAFRNLLKAFQARLLYLRQDKRLRYAIIFKNHGEAAGATLEHAHSQLIALPIVPHGVASELQGCESFFNLKNCCFFCDTIRREQQSAERLVLASSGYQVLSPYASRFPFETWIMPKRHSAAFEEATSLELEELADVFSQALKRLDMVVGKPAYSFVLRTAPFGDDHFVCEYYHWRFEVLPRLTRVAGFELATGLFVNPTPPEKAAAFLKSVKPYG